MTLAERLAAIKAQIDELETKVDVEKELVFQHLTDLANHVQAKLDALKLAA